MEENEVKEEVKVEPVETAQVFGGVEEEKKGKKRKRNKKGKKEKNQVVQKEEEDEDEKRRKRNPQVLKHEEAKKKYFEKIDQNAVKYKVFNGGNTVIREASLFSPYSQQIRKKKLLHFACMKNLCFLPL